MTWFPDSQSSERYYKATWAENNYSLLTLLINVSEILHHCNVVSSYRQVSKREPPAYVIFCASHHWGRQDFIEQSISKILMEYCHVFSFVWRLIGILELKANVTVLKWLIAQFCCNLKRCNIQEPQSSWVTATTGSGITNDLLFWRTARISKHTS